MKYCMPVGKGLAAKVDKRDAPLIQMFSWRLHTSPSGNTYAVTTVGDRRRGYKTVYMHRLILGLKKSDSCLVDHIDHDGLNNTRENLRLCTASQNISNSRVVSRSSSGYRGVFRAGRKWMVRIRKDRKDFYLGVFKSRERAALEYDMAAMVAYGEFATLNFSAEERERLLAEAELREVA